MLGPAAIRVEEASLNAWPALQQTFYDGWILRFSHGYTRRANSVNALYGSQLDLSAKIAHSEREYARRDLPVVFRLTPFSQPHDLDSALAGRGYRREAPTIVMLRELRGGPAGTGAGGVGTFAVHEQPVDAWLLGFAAVRGEPISAHETHRAILGAIAGRAQGFSLNAVGETVACALGVVEDAYAGLFDVVTAPAQRNRGFGSAVVLAVLCWAQRQGARWAYAQVMEENLAARHVYAKLGFSELYRYWYRVRD